MAHGGDTASQNASPAGTDASDEEEDDDNKYKGRNIRSREYATDVSSPVDPPPQCDSNVDMEGRE